MIFNTAPVLIFDGHGLAYRAAYSTPGMSHNGEPTGVTFGVLSELLKLQAHFATDRIVFAFDCGPGLREKVEPAYKANRRDREVDEEKKKFLDDLKKEIQILGMIILPELGVNNVFLQDGYEGDDIVAAVAEQVKESGDEAFIVAEDKDLYQCLSSQVKIYHPRTKQAVTAEAFKKVYGIRPNKWPMVKAISGCSGDNVKGVPGVGDATALKYVRGELDPKSKKFADIEASKDLIQRNLKLVGLPYEGCGSFDLCENTINKAKWKKVIKMIGADSLKTQVERYGDFLK